MSHADESTVGELDGRVALVTGGARGIGRVIAIRLAKAGAAVAVGCRTRQDAAQTVAEEIRRAGGRACAVCGDLAAPDRPAGIVAEITEALGSVDLLVHNAAPPRRPSKLLDDSWESFDLHFRAGVHGAWALAREVVPSMRSAGFGRIVLITTTSSRLYVPGFGAYSTAKGAMESFAVYLAAELGSCGITVNVIAPGLTVKPDSPVTLSPEKQTLFPTGRVPQADDVAEAVLSLVSPAAAGITGVVLPVDGGLRLLEPLRGRPPDRET